MSGHFIIEAIAFELSVVVNVCNLLLYLKVVHSRHKIFKAAATAQVIAIFCSIAWVFSYSDKWQSNTMLFCSQVLNTVTGSVILWVLWYSRRSKIPENGLANENKKTDTILKTTPTV